MSAQLDIAARGTTRAQAPAGLRGVRAAVGSARVWIIAAIVLLIATSVAFLLSTEEEDSRSLHWDSTSPTGGRALVEVMRQHGVDVMTTESLSEAQELARQPGRTVIIHDADAVLDSPEQAAFTAAAESSGNSIVLVGTMYFLEEFTEGITTSVTMDTLTGNSAEPMPAACDWDPAVRAGMVTGTARERMTATGLSEGTVAVCYHHPWDQRGYGTVAHEQLDSHDLTVIAEPYWLSNAGLDEQGNAALAFGALGAHAEAVLYLPVIDDQPWAQDSESTDPLAQVPPWFGVAFLWLIPLLLAVMLWRGRRLGPLAIERLPVVVPPVETVIGRAGLLQRSGSRVTALRALRTAALLRIARRLALPAEARPQDICLAIASRTGRDPQQVIAIFLTEAPTTDRRFAEIAALISTIESEVPHL